VLLGALSLGAVALGAIAAETRLTRRLIAAQGPVTEGAVRPRGTFVATPVEPIAPPRSFVPSRPRITEGSLFAQRAILVGFGVRVDVWEGASAARRSALARAMRDATLVVDGLFGTGLDRPVGGEALGLVDAVNAARQAEYERMRQQLERLLNQPEKDMVEVDRLINALERWQLAIKAELGIRGNNPNE
jgi:hypothetical protein